MKNYRGITPIALVVLMALSIYNMFSSYQSQNAQYKKYLKQAREYAGDGIMTDALFMYNNALEMRESLELRLETGQMLVTLGEQSEATAWAKRMVEKYKNESKAYDFLLDCYIAQEKYTDCFQLYDEAKSRSVASKDFEEKMRNMEYRYEFGDGGFEEVGVFSSGYCPVLSEEKWGYMRLSGNMAISRQFQTAGVFTSTTVEGSEQDVICAPVTDMAGDVYYINDEGKKKFIVRNIKDCTYIGPVVDNVLVAAVGEKYAYYDLDFNKLSQDYDMASTMNAGTGVVKIGEKWNIINGEFVLSDVTFDGFVLDEKGMAFRAGRAFALLDGKYYLVDTNGKKVSDEAFEEAEMFMSKGYAAVKKDGLWGFVDMDGKLVIPCQYEGAHSFTMDMAAVKKDGLWGYIDTEENVLIDYTFEDAKHINDAGNAFVDNGRGWIIMRLLKYNH